MDDPTTQGTTEGFGLMFYQARWYDPYLNHFTQPDSIVPEQTQGVQAWDRYAYVNNNPVRYDDPTGHCAIICTAVAGLVIGVAVNYTIQVANNMNSGKYSFTEALTSNIDEKQLVVAAVGGFVAGATMGIASGAASAMVIPGAVGEAAAFVTANVVGGAAANVAAGQAEAVAEQLEVNSSRCVLCWEDEDRILEGAAEDGLGNVNTMKEDALEGAAMGLVSGTVTQAIAGGSITNWTGDAHLPPNPWIRGGVKIWDFAQEYMQQDSEK
jgi:RHS repeat-associated protein